MRVTTSIRSISHPFARRAVACSLVVLSAIAPARAANPVNGLRIEPITAYNLVIDSNGKENPEAAYLSARFCNDGTATINNVSANIGNFSGSTNTPGIYPVSFQSPFVGPLSGGGLALTHEGGSLGSLDATRNIGSLAPGECKTVYWLISYESRDENGLLLWGSSVKPDDDLVLEYDFWAIAQAGGSIVTADQTRTVTFRNEISAMANKILPNTASKVPDEYLELLAKYAPEWTNFAYDGSPGTPIVTEGIWYDLGNIGHGFDNNGDLVPDKNAWMQPVGNASLLDPSCFRLVRTYAMVVVKLIGGGEQVFLVEDQLYFENMPPNNGAVGLVGYQFMGLRGGCDAQLSPYQEVASGFDNEKFNADYGAGVARLSTPTSSVLIAKGVEPPIVVPGTTMTYTISYSNAGVQTVGDYQQGTPLVIADHVPLGTYYVEGSASASNVLPIGVTNYTIYFSTNNGATYTTNEPTGGSASNVTDIQWWLNDPLDPAAAGEIEFQVFIANPYPFVDPLIVNTACLTIAGTSPFNCDEVEARLQGTNRWGDLVWEDTGVGGGLFGNQIQDGTEPGISGVVVWLYFDVNSNGVQDVSDLFIGSQTSSASGAYLFTNLVDGYYVAVVDRTSTNLPEGYSLTTPPTQASSLDPARTNSAMVQYLAADFGFAPVLSLDKERVGTNTLYEGQTITYTITVTNRMPGDGTGAGGPTVFTVWGTNGSSENPPRQWSDYTNAYVPATGPDGKFTMAPFNSAGEELSITGFPVGAQLGTITNVQIRIPFIISNNFGSSEEIEITVSRKSPAATMFTTNITCVDITNGTMVVSNNTFDFRITGTQAWNFLDFDTNISVLIVTTKSGNHDGVLGVDAVGFKIWSSATNTGTNIYTTLDPVPLTDRYNTNYLRYQSSSITPTVATNAGPTGTLYWANLGPMYAGGAVTITSQFTVLEPLNNATSSVTNITWVTNATFLSGTPANKATDTVITVISPAGQIGDYIWRDFDGDGVQDTNESGIGFVQVTLTPPTNINLGNGLGATITNMTDASGYYYFNSLPASGTYTVRVLTATLPGGSGTNTFDEDGVRNNQTAVLIDVNTSGTNNTHLTTDFGYQVGTTIEGTIWHDWDRDGASTNEVGEDMLAGITVYLCSNASPCGAGSALSTNVTDTNGYFRFVGNFTGTLSISVNTNSGALTNGTWTRSFDTDGIASSNHVTVTVPSGGVARADFSYYKTGTFTVGDTVWYDWNGNGTQQTNEEGIASITVSLYEDANGNGMVDIGYDALIGVQSTSSTGTYLFTGLPASNYLVIVDQTDPQFPSLYTTTYDPQGALDGRSAFTITTTNRLDQDFGYKPYGFGAIGDTVWRDYNFDGTQFGPLETGISNITVWLYIDANNDSNYVLYATTNTGPNGTYLFSSLPDANYRVVVNTLDGDLPTGFVPTTVTNYSIAISGGNTNLTADFGFGVLGSIGDTIFWDANENGTQDWTEPGVTNATVQLYLDVNSNGNYDAGTDTFYASQQTDSSGVYTFSNLVTGLYVVHVVETGVLFGVSLMADPDADGYPCSDTNAVGCDGNDGVTLSAGQTYVGADFGYVPRGIIGDTVWLDTDNDGIRDTNELGIAYVTVYLYTNGVPIATNQTDADGYYYFVNNPDGRYRVQVDTNDPDFPAGVVQVYDPDGGLNSQGTNIYISGGVVTNIGTNGCSGCDLNVDFGYRYSGTNSLSGTVGLDALPYNGIMGTGTTGVASNEVPFANVTAYLYRWIDSNNDHIVGGSEYVLITSTSTDTNGDYSFTGLPDGTGTNSFYIVSLAAPDSYLKLTTTNGSAIPASYIVETTNYAGNTLSAYEAVLIAPVITNMDFAFRYTINFDFGDLPNSYKTQLQDIPSGARHIVLASTNLYLGSGVDTEINGQPSTNALGDDIAGVDDEDGVIPLNAWHLATNNAGGIQFTVGAGSGWLVGYVDFTRDGDFTDPGELIVSLAVSNTGGNGSGVYSNTFAIPTNALITATNYTPFYARFRLFPSEPPYPEVAYQGLAQNGEVEDYLFNLGSVGDLVWNDQDGDGFKDLSEPPLAGVVVYLDLNADGLRQADEPYGTTDTNGIYGIGGINAGTFIARVDTTTLPVGLVPSYDLDGTSTLNSATFSMTNTQIRLDVDFGYYGSGVVGDYVWDDYDGDGVQDAGEPGISNVTVSIYNLETNLYGTSTTDSNGFYIIRALTPSNYFVVFGLPAGYERSPADAGGDDTLDSDANTNTGASSVFTLPLNTTNLTLDAGVHQPATDVAVFKTVNNTNPNINETIIYTVSITNNGPYNAALVTVTDAFPVASLSYVSNTPSQGTYNPTTLIWSVGSLNVGSNASIAFYATVNAGTAGTAITNTAWFYGMNRPDLVPTNNTGSVVLVVQAADLGVGKAVSNTNPAESNIVFYTVYVTNNGPNTASNIVVADTFPTNMTFLSYGSSQGTYTNSTGLWNIGLMTNGATGFLVITARVNGGTSGAVITNCAAVSASSHGDNNAGNNSACVELTVQSVDLVVTKAVDPLSVNEGGTIVYTIVVSNRGPVAATNVFLYDVVTNNQTYLTHGTSQGTYNGTNGSWNVGGLEVDAYASLIITAQVGLGTAGMTLTNTAFLTNSLPRDIVPTNNTGTVVVFVSNLRITKVANVSTTDPGSNITYTVTVTNSGAVTHTNLCIFDPVPTGTVFVSGSATSVWQTIYTNNVREEWNTVAYTNQNGTTNWLGNWTEINDDATAGGGEVAVEVGLGRTNIVRIENSGRGIQRSANLSGYSNAVLTFDWSTYAQDAGERTTIRIATNGTVSPVTLFTVTGNFTSFSTTNFNISQYIGTNTTLIITNNGMGNNEGARFDNIDISIVRTLTNTQTGTSMPNLTTNISLQPSYGVTLTFQVTVDSFLTLTQIVNTASTTSEIQRTPISASATTIVRNTDLGVVKTVNNANPREGSNIVYTIVITNNGSLNATGVQYTDLFPTSYVSYVTNTASTGTYNPTTRIWNVGNLAWSNSATLTITAQVLTNTAGLLFTNTIYLSAMNQADRNPTNNTSSVPVRVYGVDLGVTKVVNDSTPIEETNVVWTIVLTNNGPNDATGIILTDLIPSALVYTNHSASQGTFTNATGIWNVGNLAASNYATLTLTTFVPTNTAGNTYTNRICITALNEHDLVSTNDCASATVTPRLSNLKITKSSDAGGFVDPGQVVTYTITVTNQSLTAQGGIAITDVAPTGTVYVPSSTVVTQPQYTTNVVNDTFTTPLYSNNDGNTNWVGGWLESEGDGPVFGAVRITSDPVRGATNSLRFTGTNVLNSFDRAVNLFGYTNAVFSFDYRRQSLGTGEQLIVQVSTNVSLGSWTELMRLQGPATDAAYASTNFDIKAYVATNTGIRFVVTNLTMNASDIVWIDDVKIVHAHRQTNIYAGGATPNLASNIFLQAADWVTVTFQATADNPLSYTQIVNTGCTTGEMQTLICATCTDRVTYADLAVYKVVNTNTPLQGEVVTYTIVVTNNGAYSAAVVRITDLLPAGVTYTNHSVSQGAYSPVSGIWTVGVLGVSSSVTMTLQASVSSNTAFTTITNCAYVSNSSKVDPVMTNNTNCITITPIFDTPDVSVTNCAYVDTNGAVHLWHRSTSTNQLYDLLYVDATTFSDSLSNQWARADQRIGTLLIDTGSAQRTPPNQLGNNTLRFYRVSAPGYWESTNAPRYASAEVYAVGTVHMYPGQNWIRTWGIPCINTYGEVFGHQLAGTNTSINSIRSSFCFNFITQEVWMADMGTTNQWLYSFPTNLENQSAENLPVPLDRGTIFTLPASVQTQKLTMIFRVPTNVTVTVIKGTTNPLSPSLNLLNPNIPQTLHPTQLLLLEAGLKMGANPGPARPDQIWEYDRTNQSAINHMWVRSTDTNWAFTTTMGIVPSTFRFGYNEAIGYRRYTNDLVWTNRFYYTPPTLKMSP